MVRLTKTIQETLKDAQQYLNKAPRRANRTILQTIEEGKRFLESSNVNGKRSSRQSANKSTPVAKKIKKVEKKITPKKISTKQKSQPQKSKTQPTTGNTKTMKAIQKPQKELQKATQELKQKTEPQKGQEKQEQKVISNLPFKSPVLKTVKQILHDKKSDIKDEKNNQKKSQTLIPKATEQPKKSPTPQVLEKDQKKQQQPKKQTKKAEQKEKKIESKQKNVSKEVQEKTDKQKVDQEKPEQQQKLQPPQQKKVKTSSKSTVNNTQIQSEAPSQPILREPPTTPQIEKENGKQAREAKEAREAGKVLNEAVRQQFQQQPTAILDQQNFQKQSQPLKEVQIQNDREKPEDQTSQFIQTQGPRRTDTNQSRDPSKPIAGIIDVCFVVDTTGSMDEYLEKTRDTVKTLVSRIKEKTKEHDISVRFAFIAYRDHPPQEDTYLTQVKDLCTEKEVLEFIETLNCQGGGDGAEAVLDGLDAATKISWRENNKLPSLRYIFHICDQPPHGLEYGGYSEQWSVGCPCGLDLNQVSHKINMKEIHYRLIKASNTRLEKMAGKFKERFTNYEDTNLEGEASKMDIRISDMVIRELLPDYDYE